MIESAGVPRFIVLRFIVSHRCCVFLQIEDPPPAKRLRLALLQWPGIKPAVSLKYACTDTLSFFILVHPIFIISKG